jgi:hypothetical protein
MVFFDNLCEVKKLNSDVHSVRPACCHLVPTTTTFAGLSGYSSQHAFRENLLSEPRTLLKVENDL